MCRSRRTQSSCRSGRVRRSRFFRAGAISPGGVDRVLVWRSRRPGHLNNKDLAVIRVAFLAVRQFAGQVGNIQSAFAPRQVASFPPLRVPRPLRQPFARCLWLRSGVPRTIVQGVRWQSISTTGRTSDDTSFSFCLAREFRIRHLDREDAGQSLARVIAGDADLLALRDTAFRCVAVDLPRQGGAETGQDVSRRRVAEYCW